MSASRILITPTFRMSFPALVKPRAFSGDGRQKDSGEKSYSVEMILAPEDLGKFKMVDDQSGEFTDVDLKQVLAAVAKEEWPDVSVKESVEKGNLHWPIRDGDAYADDREGRGKKGNDHYRGHKVVRLKASEEYPPRLYYTENKERKQVVRGSDSSEQRANQMFYGGAYAFAEITVRAIEVSGKKYLTCYVNSVKFVKGGERLGGKSLMERFDGVEGGESDYDPTEGLDDDIPF